MNSNPDNEVLPGEGGGLLLLCAVIFLVFVVIVCSYFINRQDSTHVVTPTITEVLDD